LTGLEAISTHNGWAIAAVGVSIVFTGLTVLSLTIAQLHKLLALWDDRDQIYTRFRAASRNEPAADDCLIFVPGDIQEAARNFKMLADRMGEPFSLPALLENAKHCGVGHPHSALNELLLSVIIVPDKNGFYRWNKNARLSM